MAFNPAPRSAATPAAGASTTVGVAASGAAGGPLLLPSQEVPVTFSLLWEQQVDTGQLSSVEPGMYLDVNNHNDLGFCSFCSRALPSQQTDTPRHTQSAGADESEQLEGHLASDANGDLLLCLLSRKAQRLTVLRLPQPSALEAAPLTAGHCIEVAFALPAMAVAAVEATLHPRSSSCAGKEQRGSQAPPPRDLLVLQPDGRLSLHVGKRRLCTVCLPGDGTAGTATYAQLLGRGRGEHGSADARDGGHVEARLEANASQLSGSRGPPPAGEASRPVVGKHCCLLRLACLHLRSPRARCTATCGPIATFHSPASQHCLPCCRPQWMCSPGWAATLTARQRGMPCWCRLGLQPQTSSIGSSMLRRRGHQTHCLMFARWLMLSKHRHQFSIFRCKEIRP